MPSTQLRHDLQKYAVEKIGNAVTDVVQAFEIAGESRGTAMACLSATLMQVAAHIAAHYGKGSQERWLKMCTTVYTHATTEEENDNDD